MPVSQTLSQSLLLLCPIRGISTERAGMAESGTESWPAGLENCQVQGDGVASQWLWQVLQWRFLHHPQCKQFSFSLVCFFRRWWFRVAVVSVAAETSMLLKVTDLRIVDICIIVHKWMFVNEFVRVELMKTNSYVHTSAVWQMNISVFFHPCKILPQHPSTLCVRLFSRLTLYSIGLLTYPRSLVMIWAIARQTGVTHAYYV